MSGTGACSLAGSFFKKFVPGLETICASQIRLHAAAWHALPRGTHCHVAHTQ
eukprot:COSAG06_NODE_17529_length_936_cov_1.169654_3_plen_51_part_01